MGGCAGGGLGSKGAYSCASFSHHADSASWAMIHVSAKGVLAKSLSPCSITWSMSSVMHILASLPRPTAAATSTRQPLRHSSVSSVAPYSMRHAW